jgi:hypothetical protein
MENKIEEIFIVINKIELASELAEQKLLMEVRLSNGTFEIYEEDESEVRYTEKAQDRFNHYYDEYLTLIEQCNVNLRKVKR